MTAGEIAALLREERKWSPAEEPGICMRCGAIYQTGDPVAYDSKLYEGRVGPCCKTRKVPVR